MTVKNLTVRLDPETREKLEIIANRELRPMANQIVVFVRQSIDRYLEENNLEFGKSRSIQDDGSLLEEGFCLQERQSF